MDSQHIPNVGQLQEAVIAEAKSWLMTPYHHRACVKGSGVDCACLFKGVFEGVGLVKDIEIPHYPEDWHFHQARQLFREVVEKYAVEVPNPVRGGIVMFEFGKAYSHGAIILDWPLCIHSCKASRIVEYIDAELDVHLSRARKVFFSPWEKK
jgi:cell wall-associated NlpC family hydrolase